MATLILTGDVNLMNVTDPAVPFALVRDELRSSDLVFSNLECCLYTPAHAHSFHTEGFFADPAVGIAALQDGNIDAVGIANNVNYGEAAILSSVGRLDRAGIPHTGAGADLEAATAPVVIERGRVNFGFLQRSAVYWPTNHEAGPHDAGIAVLRAHTAYQVPLHKTRPDIPPLNRPGVPPVIITWPDPEYLGAFTDDIAALAGRTDIVVASCHWGLDRDVLHYMRQVAHAAIDAGAHIVVGHGPHHALAVEVYRGHPIFYGLGSFCFHTGHGGRPHGDWIGMMARAAVAKGQVLEAHFRFVRHNASNETIACRLADEQDALDDLVQRSSAFGTVLHADGDWVRVALK